MDFMGNGDFDEELKEQNSTTLLFSEAVQFQAKRTAKKNGWGN